jgi:hypothetical protein
MTPKSPFVWFQGKILKIGGFGGLQRAPLTPKMRFEGVQSCFPKPKKCVFEAFREIIVKPKMVLGGLHINLFIPKMPYGGPYYHKKMNYKKNFLEAFRESSSHPKWAWEVL